MKNIIILVAGIIIGNCITIALKNKDYQELENANNFKRELLKAYDNYYYSAETALDTLNLRYDWVDDGGFDDYYESRDSLNALMETQL